MMRIVRYVIPIIVLLVWMLISPAPALALLPQHAGFGCLGCHNLHGGGGGALLGEANSESTCLSCHGPLATATEVTIHDPNGHLSGNLGYITCLECHNPHNNDRLNANGGTNIKLIGVVYDFNDTNVPRTYLTSPQIREEAPLPAGLGTLREVVFETSPADWSRSGDGLGLCNACHGATHNVGEDCAACHAHNDSFIGKGCTGCHDGTGAGALSVSVNSPHATNVIFSATGDTFLCEDCHTGHGAGTIEIPNNTTVGINYGSNGESGIALGSAVATGATEAEICWNCHNSYGVSEWGTNTQISTGSSSYNYGSANSGSGIGWYADTTVGSEVGATWNSANFGYKTGTIQSTHSVDGTATTPGLDPVDNIRCSYCHDVHDLNSLASDSSSGKPYLRGTWMGNPYKEDGAPQSGTTYTANTSNDFGPVPRADNSTSMEMGGYWIDQNTTDTPTSLGWTADSSSALCALCHGSNTDGTWDLIGSGSGNDIDNLNEFDFNELGNAEAANVSWVGTNGHSNAVLGGTGLQEVNIFSEAVRKPVDGYCGPNGADDNDGNAANDDGYCAGYPDMAYQQFSDETNVRGFGLRGHIMEGEGFYVDPNVRVNQPYAYTDYAWGATVDETTPDSQYHQFSCSKCHNPHASRLPRLMITNCLDIEHNTWDDAPVGVRNGTEVQISGSGNGNNGTFNAVGMAINGNTPVMLFTNNTLNTNESGGFTVTIDPGGSNEIYTEGSNNTFEIETSVNIGGTNYDIVYDDLNKESTLGRYIVGRRTPPKGVDNKSGSQIYDDNDDVQLAYATSAQNCHRYEDANNDGDGIDPGDEEGWNTVTPW